MSSTTDIFYVYSEEIKISLICGHQTEMTQVAMTYQNTTEIDTLDFSKIDTDDPIIEDYMKLIVNK